MIVIFYIFKAVAWSVSLLPFPVLYFLSDILYFSLYRVFSYRKKIVRKNLHNAFPEKPLAEIKKIEKRFYRNLSDIILEVIKTRHITRKQMLSRYSLENYELLKKSYNKDQSVIIAIGHCGNWEWMGNYMSLLLDVKGFAIVKPLSNKLFDDYINKLRNRFTENSVIYFKETFRKLIKNKNRITLNVFAADQTPTRGEINFWTNFFNQDTPFYLGIEKIAKSLNMAVYFMDIQRTKRGRYKGVFHLITDKPKETEEFEITEKYVNLLEQAIRGNPDNWLWSHRRWKHKRKNQQTIKNTHK